MARWMAIGATAVLSAIGTLGFGAKIAAPGQTGITEATARGVVVEFFRSQNERRFDRTCGLLSRGFYDASALPDRPTCVALLRVGFLWSGRIEFRIRAVEHVEDGFVVRAIADGAPGRIVLVREGRNLRILAVRGE